MSWETNYLFCPALVIICTVEIENCERPLDFFSDIRRGCFDGTYGINETLLGCHIQGPHDALYCFCDDDLCNGGAAGEYEQNGNLFFNH